ncbi:DUF3509 domain-containing protein [Pseudomonas sp. 148P]|uniref:DUF3509 domain-containing protein n=1 Tax=Pseudomonas ulcerans TaxID=3115852 RepID=A0ABU7HRV6_9PSED|nr:MULTISPECIES: DUF3509 domain-containing protein [unclassified Pseudomonas]MEE1922065.1 DUF3509 domain-containing protein [Pseudomonas sp. 147P]MEE1934275.1 DUF3509 domain-containing protein [Pseudomonas sp. 148P]
MESISVLLNEALAPYQVTLVPQGTGDFSVSLRDENGFDILQRTARATQLQDQRLLVDLVDGLQRDLRIAEGRLQPCVIAAWQHARQGRGLSATL